MSSVQCSTKGILFMQTIFAIFELFPLKKKYTIEPHAFHAKRNRKRKAKHCLLWFICQNVFAGYTVRGVPRTFMKIFTFRTSHNFFLIFICSLCILCIFELFINTYLPNFIRPFFSLFCKSNQVTFQERNAKKKHKNMRKMYEKSFPFYSELVRISYSRWTRHFRDNEHAHIVYICALDIPRYEFFVWTTEIPEWVLYVWTRCQIDEEWPQNMFFLVCLLSVLHFRPFLIIIIGYTFGEDGAKNKMKKLEKSRVVVICSLILHLLSLNVFALFCSLFIRCMRSKIFSNSIQ